MGGSGYGIGISIGILQICVEAYEEGFEPRDPVYPETTDRESHPKLKETLSTELSILPPKPQHFLYRHLHPNKEDEAVVRTGRSVLYTV